MDSNKTVRPFTVIVEGNIGSGKSTFLNHFLDLPNVDVLTEPVDKWCNVGGKHNLLQLMYEDPSRHSLTFQSYVQLTMTQLHVKKPSSTDIDMKVMERSLYSSRHCFVENLWRSGKLADSEFGVLCEWYKFLTTNKRIDLGVDFIVYLRTQPEVAWERVKARSRSEEKVIPLEYLQTLHQLHEEWLVGSQSTLPAPVLVVDVDQDLSSCPQLYKTIVNEVLQKAELLRQQPKSADNSKENQVNGSNPTLLKERQALSPMNGDFNNPKANHGQRLALKSPLKDHTNENVKRSPLKENLSREILARNGL